MIRKILVANRGEIAVRIIRSCRESGIRSVAIYSEPDRTSMHVRYADEAWLVGPGPSGQSYLNIPKILEIAKKSEVDAIHPGYGFLSENAEFAEKVRQAGLIFIGPEAEAIRTMGDKMKARELMIKAGVPVVPGSDKLSDDDEENQKIAEKTGYPIMIKASAGGGGKGMRFVESKEELNDAIKRAKSEALNAFGDDAVYIEKYLKSPHHIEVQILGDEHGNVVHLFERECSVQRRHQKVVEETPSPFITEEVRKAMTDRAVAAAASVKYAGAGTVEFLVDADMNFYFLEMNTRLQVEHPITERTTGVDLVKAQIRIANGEPLAFKQQDIRKLGHAIECRIYAEDPDNNFMPGAGRVLHITEPLGLGVRTDGYIYEGYDITVFYDPMISKLIIWAQNREEAVERMKRALYEYKITGVKTNIQFLERIMNTPEFREGKYDTHFIANNEDYLLKGEKCQQECEDLAMIMAYVDHQSNTDKRLKFTTHQYQKSNWKEYGRLHRFNPF
ncbi:acetyl-CoA carboxylase biotin carboxylase subunit [Marinilabilia rubra]|uniref:Acetyl-CoA carboxylase biotin carboxylase subunit n=1 Tax=Marinilabilia rubra TaxID=2162893 RepID=A0A2U2BCC9_9BACT|nr:acetyl-CoA carboxylase biotin carboxylase subunit [Marinilabilia rubra]PWE00719.1 acetyl-CoA carboxylase biotin carboxylase subunit [Marinilabilia rubra]